MSAVLRRGASRPEAARHAEPPEALQGLPGHDGSGTSAVRIRFQISADVNSGRLIEVEISALVSDAEGAQVPVQAARRESRLAEPGRGGALAISPEAIERSVHGTPGAAEDPREPRTVVAVR